MNKLYGKHLGFEIAFGRKMVKCIQKSYRPERLNEKTSKDDAIV